MFTQVVLHPGIIKTIKKIWILVDILSNCEWIFNRYMLKYIHHFKIITKIYINPGWITINQRVLISNYRWVWNFKNRISKIISLNNMR